jgi:vitamin K-dependent gamma-carboxylase
MTKSPSFWDKPKDMASLSVFRMFIGAIVCVSLIRFQLEGWIETVFVEPSFFFKYPGFTWVRVWSAPFLYVLFSGLALCAFCVAIGFFYRVSIAILFLGFTYIQLMDVTNYLNHYYLVVLLLGLMNFLPLNAMWSVDALRKPTIKRRCLPAWMLYLIRFQIAVVYINAGFAKLGPDWLLYAQPMNLWMSAQVELPIIGGFLDKLWVAYAMSWAGCIYDLTIVGFLLHRKTRVFAYAAVVVFHALTLVFFDIGMFPFIMILGSTVFFTSDWPRRFFLRDKGLRHEFQAPAKSLTRPVAVMLCLYCVVQLLIPLRHHLSEHDVLWGEQGMRYSWRVMVREKNGSITYHVRSKRNGRTWLVSPHDYLTWRQVSEMSGQPDLILQLARHIGDDFFERGLGVAEVRAEAWVSLNGRKPALLIDPQLDLLTVQGHAIASSSILPAPDELPIQLKPRIRVSSRMGD